MIVVERIAELRDRCDAARRAGKTVGLVPTMGFFHEGHRSLMRGGRANDDLVVTTIFVNPLQFAAHEDLAGYPRDLDADTAAAEAEGVDVLFVPSVPEMYPEPTVTTVHVAGLTDGLCGAARPTHFDGVAMSSRNAYLSHDERRRATGIFASLRRAAAVVEGGERDPVRVRAAVEAEAARHGLEPEYAEVRRASDLAPLATLDGEVVVAVAAAVGTARLIDNITMQIAGAEVAIDLGVVPIAEQESAS
jgi:pantoate--beta-alanine ligase